MGVGSALATCHARDMEETPFNGFRIEVIRPDENAEGGFRSMTFLVVAEFQEDAEGAVRAYLRTPCTLNLLEHGPAVLAEARRLGMTNGEVRVS